MSSRAAGSSALVALLVALSVVGVWGPASALAQVGAGRRALEEADFQRALRAFDRAERSESLDRAELTALYEGRSMARFALGDEPGARADLRALGELDPTHAFPAEAPPELGSLLGELVRAAGGGLAFELRWSGVSGGSALSVEVQRDAASLVRTVRIHTRVGIRGRWRTEEARSVVVTHPPGVRVYFHVEALGPGGAVLLEQGSRQRPLVRGVRESDAEPTWTDGVEDPSSTISTVAIGPPPVRGEEPAPGALAPSAGDDDTGLVIGLSVGAGVAVVAAVIIGVVVGTQSGSSITQPSAPVVVGF